MATARTDDLVAADRSVESNALSGGQPLEMLHDFRGLDSHGHRQVFRRVELIPITPGCELPLAIAQFVQAVDGQGGG